MQPAVTVTYAGGGSGKGQTDLQAGLVQWAGSDSTVKPEDVSKYKGPFLYFPTVGRADHGLVQPLGRRASSSCRPDTIARIFQGKITTWDDAAIKADNPGADLPEHRDHGRAPLRRVRARPRTSRST